MSLTIRLTETGDLPALLAIYNSEVLHSTATLDLHAKTLRDWECWLQAHQIGNHFALTALRDGVPVGYATLSGYREKEAYKTTVELSVYVDAHHRRTGVASALMTETLRLARERGDVHTVVSVITGENAESVALHEKFGFSYCGTVCEVGQKFGRMLDIKNYQLIL